MTLSGKVIWNHLLAVLTLLATSTPIFAKGPKMKPEELVARHLEALGSQEARIAAQSRTAKGRGQVRLIVGGSGILSGPARFVCEGEKVLLSIRFKQVNYPAERFSFDSKKAYFGHLTPGRRSALGDFLHQHDHLVKHGLLGGALSTAWPLLDVKAKKPKLKYKGLKKINDRQLLELEYRPRKSWGDVKTKLYFDPETFRHIATINKVEINPRMGATLEQSRRMQKSRFKLEEWFEDFQRKDGLELPVHWTIRLEIETDQGSFIGIWEMAYSEITHNLPIDSEQFVVR